MNQKANIALWMATIRRAIKDAPDEATVLILRKLYAGLARRILENKVD